MSQYILSIKNSKQAEALIQYLQSLEFVELSAVKTDAKAKAATKAAAFLESLPNQPSKQSAVNKAVKSIRKKYGYQ
jgi:hypothetical protein